MTHDEVGDEEGAAEDDSETVEVRPWERLPGEGDKAYHAFSVYREMGPRRSVRKAVPLVYQDTTPEDAERRDISVATVRQMAKWSSRWHWVDRARAFDAYEEADRLADRRDAIRQMEQRHSQIAVRAQVKALEALEALELTDFTAGDVIRFITEGAKLERLARGEATSREEVSGKDGEPLRVAVTVEQLEDKIAQIARMRSGAD